MSEAERALSLDPTMVGAYANLGEASMALGRFDKGLEFFDKAIRLSVRTTQFCIFGMRIRHGPIMS